MNGSNRWFEKNRDLHLRELLDAFFRVSSSFTSILEIYLKYSQPAGSENGLRGERDHENMELGFSLIWDRLTLLLGTEAEKGPLWRLKDDCHLLWRESLEERGHRFDWHMGSIFHEAMKLKENIYLLKKYGPEGHNSDHATGTVETYSPSGAAKVADTEHPREMIELMREISDDVFSQLYRLGWLLVQARYLLRLMLDDFVNNELVVRLLVEREEMLFDLWGEHLEDIFAEMFFGDAAAGFCAAGASYMRGQWYAEALKMYRRALAIDKTCDEALIKTAQLEAVFRDNRNLPGIG